MVSNISPKLSLHHIKTFFSFCGKIERIDMGDGNYIGLSVLNAPDAYLTNLPLNASKLEIKYFTEHAAETACLLDQTQLMGSYIRIRRKSERQLHPLLEADWEEYLHENDDGAEEHTDSVPIDADAEELWDETHIRTFSERIQTHARGILEGKFTSYASSPQDSRDRSLYVGNIHGRAKEHEFVGIMSICGPIVNFQLAGDPSNSTRFGFVEYMHKEDQELALELMHGIAFFGLLLKVSECKKPIGNNVTLSSAETAKLSRAQIALTQKLKKHLGVEDRGQSPPKGRTLSPVRTLDGNSGGRRSPSAVKRASSVSSGARQSRSPSAQASGGGGARGRRTSRTPPPHPAAAPPQRRNWNGPPAPQGYYGHQQFRGGVPPGSYPPMHGAYPPMPGRAPPPGAPYIPPHGAPPGPHYRGTPPPPLGRGGPLPARGGHRGSPAMHPSHRGPPQDNRPPPRRDGPHSGQKRPRDEESRYSPNKRSRSSSDRGR